MTTGVDPNDIYHNGSWYTRAGDTLTAAGFSTIPVDASGNILANVLHRTGTLASLLTLAGGNGEIGVATDVNALVKYNGVAGQAVAFYRNRYSHIAAGTANGGTPVVSTLTQCGINPINDVSGLIDNANGWILSPTPGVTVGVEVMFSMGCDVDTTGTYREVYVQYDSSNVPTWLQFPRGYFQFRPPVAGVDSTGINYSGFVTKFNLAAYKFRIMVRHDVAAGVAMSGPVEFKFLTIT